MNRELLRLAEKTSSRLRARSLVAGTIQIKIREPDFTTCTRQRKLHPPSSGTDQLYGIARALLSAWLEEHPGATVRLLGVGGSDLAPGGQQDLFAAPDSDEKPEIDQTVDRIRARFGGAAVGRARTLNRS
jgi:DNA polymerase-4